MKKIPFLTNERLSRLMVSLLMCLGLLMPLVMTFGAEAAMVQAIVTACVLLALFSVLGSLRRGRIILCAVVLPLFMGEWGIYLSEIAAWVGAAILLIWGYYYRMRQLERKMAK